MSGKLCFVCGKESYNRYPLCNSCSPRVINPNSSCNSCGVVTSSFVSRCPTCRDRNSLILGNYSLFSYLGISKEILKQYKFKGEVSFSVFFGELISNYIKTNFKDPIICPIPTSRLKRKMKGGYQLDQIVKELKKRDLPIIKLLKKRYSKTQKKLNRDDRRTNLLNSFYLRSKIDMKNRDIILLDDVYTTGATIEAAAKIISTYYNNSIYSITIYRD